MKIPLTWIKDYVDIDDLGIEDTRSHENTTNLDKRLC